MNAFIKFFWFLTLIASLVASGVLLLTTIASTSAPQQAAGAATAGAIAAIAYVFTRAAESLAR